MRPGGASASFTPEPHERAITRSGFAASTTSAWLKPSVRPTWMIEGRTTISLTSRPASRMWSAYVTGAGTES